MILQIKEDPSQQPENIVIMGWCVPASCRPIELQNHLNQYLYEVEVPLKRENVTYSAMIPENFCQKQGEYKQMDLADVSFG